MLVQWAGSSQLRQEFRAISNSENRFLFLGIGSRNGSKSLIYTETILIFSKPNFLGEYEFIQFPGAATERTWKWNIKEIKNWPSLALDHNTLAYKALSRPQTYSKNSRVSWNNLRTQPI